jgi:tRNA-2-methylthio-N6-dimethylallyladenosine synthase
MLGVMKSFHIVTYGCQMNKHDSEKIAGLLAAKGFKMAASKEEADIIVYNTCTVRQHAEDRLLGNVASLKALKRKKPEVIIAIGGCLAQQEQEKIFKKLPHVDIVFGTKSISYLPELIKRVSTGDQHICLADMDGSAINNLPRLRQEKHHGWVSITIGCNNFCSYCIVPYVRGEETSRRMEEIVEEVKRLVADGVIEVTLLGQNVNSYGTDLYGKSQFANLLEKLNEIEDLQRIRFTTSHPKDLSVEIIRAVAECERVCEHIHLPVQAGSTRVLKAMNRKYTKEQYLELIEQLYEGIPGVSITTDIMVGFPGETEEDFEDTLEVVRKARFDSAFTFIYSPRKGTLAAKMSNQIPHEVKIERFNRLVKLQNSITLEKNQALVGRTVEVLVEGRSKKDKNMLTGRTRTNKVVNFPYQPGLLHLIVKTRIKKAHTWSLTGELVSGASH